MLGTLPLALDSRFRGNDEWKVKSGPALIQPSDQRRHLADRRELVEALVARQFLVALEGGGDDIGDVHPMAADLQDRQDVRGDRIADHDHLRRVQSLGGEDAAIGLGILLRDDLDMGEALGQAGFLDPVGLVEQIALGDEQQAVPARQRIQGGDRRRRAN